MNNTLIVAEPTLLHDLHVGSLGGEGIAPQPPAVLALEANFGGVDRWRAEFGAMALGAGAGWVVLSFVPRDGTLVNQSVGGPMHAPDGGIPILALDTQECSSARVDAFLANVDWARVYERYQHAVHDASEPFGATADELSEALLIDVRRAGMYEQADTLIPGARWRDPASVGAWGGDIPAGRDVVVYCVYGHEVGRATALRLRARGLSARFLRGGIDGWRSAGRPLQAKGAPS